MRRELSLSLLVVVAAGCGGLTDPGAAGVTSSITRTPASFPATTATLDVTLPPLTAAEQAVLSFGARTMLTIDSRVKTTGLVASAGGATVGTDGTIGSLTVTGNATVGDRTH